MSTATNRNEGASRRQRPGVTFTFMNGIDQGNLGNVDRLVRVLSGGALLALCVVGPVTVWGLVGVATRNPSGKETS